MGLNSETQMWDWYPCFDKRENPPVWRNQLEYSDRLKVIGIKVRMWIIEMETES